MLIESPSEHATELEVDPSFAAARVSLWPTDYSNGELVGGHYRVAPSTGLVTGAAAAGALLSLRWADANRGFALLRAIVQAVVTTPSYPSPPEFSVDLVRVKNFTVADTGGTGITLGDENRLSARMGNSQVADLRVATTGALTNGTGTAEAVAKATALLRMDNVQGSTAREVLFDAAAGVEHPFELQAGQGFRIRLKEAQGTSGVTKFHFVLVWAEVPKRFGG